MLTSKQQLISIISGLLLLTVLILPTTIFAQNEEEIWITNPTSGVELYCHIHRPADFNSDYTYPALVMVPGGSGAGTAFDINDLAQQYADLGFITMHFDADDRGLSTNNGAYTEENYCGYIHQDGMHAVLQYLADLPETDVNNVGVVTFFYGTTMGAGALGRYHLLDGQKNPWKTEEECCPSTVSGDLNSVSSLSLLGIDGSAIQVRVNTGDTTICFLIDRMTGEYLGPCPH